jgi:aryl-alcohol dehydrogenase-like predicted oxidoreductase
MKTRKLGSQGLEASAQGLGCMGMSAFYGDRDDDESTKTIHRALELGITLFDSAEMYGPYLNEELIGEALEGRDRDSYAIATKFGIKRDMEADPPTMFNDGTPENVRSSIEGSLQRLQTDHVDLYYLHRIDPGVPVEETFGALGELVTEGKVRYLGISEAAPDTIRKAHETAPLSAVQTEYSLWTRDPETNGVLDACRELGIAFVAYSPLGRGFLTGKIRDIESLDSDDYRRFNPRFEGDNLESNIAIVEKLDELAAAKGITAAQLALAWVHSRGEDVFPIPGTKRRTYLEDNVAAFDVELNDDDLASLESATATVAGDRYDESGMASVNR